MTEIDNVNSDGNSKYKDGVNRNARLIVRNVSFKATEENLKEHFSQYGTVEEVKLLKKPDGRLVGCAFVHYTHVPMANKALNATNKKPFLGRPIYVAWAVPQHKYNEETQNNGSKKRFKNYSEDSKPEIKDEPVSKEEKDNARVNRRARLIVRNISFKATEESLKDHFAPYGVIQEVKLLKKPDGKLVGCAFVHYKNVPMAKEAILNTNLKPFLGRPISVDWAVPKDKYMQHVINKQIEMEENIKREDSDSDNDDSPMNVSTDDVKQEIKSESDDDEHESEKDGDDDDDDQESDSEKDEKSESEDDGNESEEESEGDEDDEDGDDDDKSVTSSQPDIQRRRLNDAEDGCTVFLTNIPFSVDNDQLKTFAEKTGPVKYALICVDKLTEHSRGSGFVKFTNKEDADRFLSLEPSELKLEGQTMQVRPALKRDNLTSGNKKQPKDNRNLYLVKEGVIVAGTKAAVGVSASDMAKRLALERSKTQMLKNLNRFVSRYRLVVSNLPPSCDDARLRRECARAAPRAAITEARVMRDLRAPLQRDGKHPSKGYGFVMFMRHEDALACLRKLNNNPDIFDKNNRPIVSFSIEDRTALNARKKRLEKSVANNPLAKKGQQENENKDMRKFRKRKHNAPDESYMKKRKFDNNNEQKQEFGKIKKRKFENKNQEKQESGKFVKRSKETEEYLGLTAREGSQHQMRSNYKLKTQANIHRQTIKLEKKKNKRTMRLKMAARERIKQPKQKINKNKTGKRNKKRKFDDQIF
ncbi:RNA-binding protein 28-like [Melitaea cinxia]|uniref:RNA-binding protein 28-like n=1 Tax=Melitaea cinxia TaxID=113334 RepID=UPI001E2711C5|nr:RNA-binding protein 28-like [Melitaea cinxia]